MLTPDEAWEMFKNVLGKYKIDSLQDESLAKSVCIKCAHLPLLIVAVEKSVAIMLEHQWKDALDQIILNLKLSSLLLKGMTENYITLQDIIRGVARSIASRPKYAFLSVMPHMIARSE